jgi:hypothetical protein
LQENRADADFQIPGIKSPTSNPWHHFDLQTDLFALMQEDRGHVARGIDGA